MYACRALSFSHASEFAAAQCEIPPYVQEFLLQRRQCVRVINSYLDHRNVADVLTDSYNLEVRALVSVDKLLQLRSEQIILTSSLIKEHFVLYQFCTLVRIARGKKNKIKLMASSTNIQFSIIEPGILCVRYRANSPYITGNYSVSALHGIRN